MSAPGVLEKKPGEHCAHVATCQALELYTSLDVAAPASELPAGHTITGRCSPSWMMHVALVNENGKLPVSWLPARPSDE